MFVLFCRPEDVASVDVYTAKGLLSIGHRYLDVRCGFILLLAKKINDRRNSCFFWSKTNKKILISIGRLRSSTRATLKMPWTFLTCSSQKKVYNVSFRIWIYIYTHTHTYRAFNGGILIFLKKLGISCGVHTIFNFNNLNYLSSSYTFLKLLV